MLAGVLAGLPKVFSGHLVAWLPALSILTFVVLFSVVPVTLVICNAAAYQGGGRRVLRCLAITTTLLGGLVLTWWLAHSAPHTRTVFHRGGRITFSYLATRVHGLLSWAASVVMFGLSASILLHPADRPRPSPPAG